MFGFQLQMYYLITNEHLILQLWLVIDNCNWSQCHHNRQHFYTESYQNAKSLNSKHLLVHDFPSFYLSKVETIKSKSGSCHEYLKKILTISNSSVSVQWHLMSAGRPVFDLGSRWVWDLIISGWLIFYRQRRYQVFQRSGAKLRNNQFFLLSTEIAVLEIAESVLM